MTIRDYLAQNKIVETQVRPGEPGTPVVKLPVPPPGWSDAGDQAPDWSVGTLVSDRPSDPNDPATIAVVLSRLTGDVDQAKILEYAPGELRNLPGYAALSEPAPSTLSGFEAVQLSGTYNRDGTTRVIAQKTVAVPGRGGLYVLQINADGAKGDENAIQEATGAIDQFTTIAP